MSVSSAERAGLRRELMEMAGEAFDAMFDPDQQEQLITMTQREDRVLEKGAGLQSWLLARHLARDPWAQPRSGRFGEFLAMEAHRRSLDLASRKAYVCDGQAYNWTIWGEHFRSSGFVPVLDFVHLLTYVHSAAHAAGGSASGRRQRYERWLRCRAL